MLTYQHNSTVHTVCVCTCAKLRRKITKEIETNNIDEEEDDDVDPCVGIDKVDGFSDSGK